MNDTMDLVIPGFCGMGMHLRLDGFRIIYVLIAIVMWAVCGLFSLEYMRHYGNRRRYYVFFLDNLPGNGRRFPFSGSVYHIHIL